MIPLTSITGSTLNSIFVYTSVLGILLLIATWLRLKSQLLKRLYIPASLIAGIIGLILGPHFIGIIPVEMTTYWSALSGRLIVLVFAPMLMGSALPNFKKLANLAGPSIAWSYGATFAEYAIPLLLSALLFTPLWGINEMFGTIVEQGWAGGHGTAGGMALVFEELHWTNGASLSVTSATIGLIFGIVGGTVMINIGVRKGWSAVIKSPKTLNNDETEIFGIEGSNESTKTTISPNVIDSFAFHAALVSVAVFIGWILNQMLKLLIHFSVSWFVTALFGGLIVQLIVNRTKWAKAVDKSTLSRIQGISLEFLVAGAVASVNVPIVVEYAVPLIIQQSIMMVVMLFMALYVCRKIFPEYWFENSMVLFGTYSGVSATGLLLLRTCDPEMKSGVAEVFAARSPFTSAFLGGGLLTSITPGLVVQYGALKVGSVYLAGLVIVFILFRVFKWWHPITKNNISQSNAS